jgi:hypothetical protein
MYRRACAQRYQACDQPPSRPEKSQHSGSGQLTPGARSELRRGAARTYLSHPLVRDSMRRFGTHRGSMEFRSGKSARSRARRRNFAGEARQFTPRHTISVFARVNSYILPPGRASQAFGINNFRCRPLVESWRTRGGRSTKPLQVAPFG